MLEYGRILVDENLYSRIFYAMVAVLVKDTIFFQSLVIQSPLSGRTSF